MGVRIAGTMAHLEGDWTMAGAIENINSLVHSLNQLESEGKKSLQINCQQVNEADTSCLQLLSVWVECARLRGIEPTLVNVTDGLLRDIHKFGFTQCLFSTNPDGCYAD